MSIFSSIANLFKKLIDIVLKILKWLIPILIIVLIVIAIFFPYLLPIIWAWVGAAWAAIGSAISAAWSWLAAGASGLWTALTEWVGEASFMEVLKMAAGAAIILNPEGAAEAVGELASSVGGVISDVVTSVAKAIPWYVWAAGGVGLFFWLSGDDDESQRVEIVDRGGERYGPT